MTPRLIFWRTFYLVANPFRHLYWHTFHPKSRGVKCLIEREGKFLLVRLTYSHKGWTLPGGGVNRKETFEQGAARELFEETGVAIPTLTLIGEYENRNQGKIDTVQCFYGESSTEVTNTDPLEIAEAAWFKRGDFPINRSFRINQIMGYYDNQKRV